MPLTYLSIAFLIGVFVASLGDLPDHFRLFGLVVGVAGLIASRWIPALRLLALSLLVVVVGVWRYDASAEANVNGSLLAAVAEQREVEVRGVVEAPPEMREMRQNIRLALNGMHNNGRWEEAQGTLLIFADVAPAFEYGDSLEVVGKVEDPPEFEGFSYREYLLRQGIRHVTQRPYIKLLGRSQGLAPMVWIYPLRARLSQVLGSTLPEPEASVAQGVLLGIRSSMPRDLLNSFAITGTTHILAISGYNIALIAAVLVAFATRLVGRNRAAYVAAVGIGFYAVLAGASPSVLRATVMGILVIVAYRAGRQSHVLNALAISAAALVAIQPYWLWDIGFQLSFLATVGLVFVSRPLSALLSRAANGIGVLANPFLGEVSGFLIEGLSITFAATIYTLPLIAFNFHTISLISPMANVAAVPALPPIIAGAAAVALLGLFLLPLAQVAAYLAWPFMAYLVGVVSLFARLPGASVPAPPVDTAFVWAYYAILACLTVALHSGLDGLAGAWLRIREGGRLAGGSLAGVFARLPATLTVPSVLLVAVVAWAAVFSIPDGKLHVTFLDIGQGDAILVKTSDGQKLLVDGGPSAQRLLNQLGKHMPFWDRTVDVVVLSHPDDDHLAGLVGMLDRYQTKLVLESPRVRSNPLYQSWQDEITRKGIRREILRSGQQLRVGNLEIAVIFVPELLADDRAEHSNESVVIKLKMADVSFLLPGDTPAENQFNLLVHEEELKSTVLKVPHHGARDALDGRFLDVVNPQLAVISVGADNPFGHPAPETTALLAGARTLRTDEVGSIEAVTDGRKLWIKTRRQ